ncbi:Protein of uncharacterised function (DUF3046) [Corynebacterium renale]|uniref:DUF3046 family protein n=1 Tax=Corynebacterium renale TaxID=1724 RepID=A0A2A9DQA9_9CORY|nr:DUF3046 domain-containing protein [Corynebacterium renale]PFG28546.1 Protein of unknown function (DUF3046) [Corynebacterium renale]SQG64860.1 Protein of uncharacterised function (DUF3046) [Corynebacterium renale]SQI26236.1 Protein of uncharacterised function (DUF3046) [Corynebacterium renale]STC96455.1 Protein of uncharacterised function (DUF3046) [Corynebacterium renale]
MRLAEFFQLIEDEFGTVKADFVYHSHFLAGLGGTAEQLIDDGVDPNRVWGQLCDDFEVPADRRLGRDE